MSIAIDILLVAVFLFFTVRFWRLGLACSVLSSCKLLFSILCASLLARPVAMIVSLVFDSSSMSDGAVSVLSGIMGFALSFVVVFILSGLIIRMISKIKIPVITKIDKILGLLLGVIVGALSVSLISTAVYSVAEIIGIVGNDPSVMGIYRDSYVFKFVYDLKLFDFIRNMI